LALLLAVLAIGPFYLSLALPSWPAWSFGADGPQRWLWSALYFHHVFFSMKTVYVAASFAVAVVAAMALRREPLLRRRALLGIVLMGVLAVPLLYRYSPAVEAAGGRALRWPTEPDWIDGVAKRAQTVFDTSCHYELLGWSEAGELFYERWCNNRPPWMGQTTVFAYQPESGDRRQVEAPPAALHRTSASARAALAPSTYWRDRLGYLAYTRRADYDDPFDWMLPEPALASPDGRWVAARARHAIYRAEDVVVVAALPVP
jgi:hypothetical protein